VVFCSSSVFGPKRTFGTVVVLKVRFGPKTEEEQKATTPKRKPRSAAAKTADVR